MELKGRIFVIEMIAAAAILLLGLWWFRDCLHHADVFNVPAVFGTQVEARPIQPQASDGILIPMSVEKKRYGEMRSIRGYREM